MTAATSSPPDAEAHAFARGRGVSPRLYAFMRGVSSVILRAWFRIRVSGAERLSSEGPVVVVSNHKNFLDPFFIGIATQRHVRYMAKAELFRGPFGWLFLRLGAFPVRRGEADLAAMETARRILLEGGVVVMFPEGTRVEAPDALGSPHHGAGRLAVQTGAPIVPAAITGTSHLWRGALPHLKRVRLAFLPAITPKPAGGADQTLALIDRQAWPAVREEYGRLRATPGLIAAELAVLGVGGGLLARRRRAQPPRLVGTVPPRRVRHARRRVRRRR